MWYILVKTLWYLLKFKYLIKTGFINNDLKGIMQMQNKLKEVC